MSLKRKKLTWLSKQENKRNYDEYKLFILESAILNQSQWIQ